ncbi:MAG: ABC transporter ATP-binding protein [Promethearchaeota archaeon]
MSSNNTDTTSKSELAIEADHLTFTYAGSTKPALQGIQLDIRSGEFVLLAGPSGCGKSTLARCLAGFIPHEFSGQYQGVVRISGMDTNSSQIHNIARNISLVQQDPDGQIVCLNVTDEVAFGPENFNMPLPKITEYVKKALKSTNALSLEKRSTLTLSGGEKQKVAIAGFLAIQAPILILDEPTTRLDSPTSHEVLSALSKLHNSGTTILVIDHRIAQLLPLVSRCLLMKEGHIIFDGTPQQLRKQPTLLNELGVYLTPKPLHESITQQNQSYLGINPVLTVQDLKFTYPNSKENHSKTPVLNGLSFTLGPSEIVGLMGSNGSGKTTLLKNIVGLLRPDAGSVYIADKLVHSHHVSEIARDVGFIFQNPLHQLFERTVWDELLLTSRQLKYPPQHVAAERSKSIAEKCGLTQYLNWSPFSLSLGEQRRLTISSILVHQPKLLLLDEPFIGQDYGHVHQLMSLVQSAALDGAAILLATHDPSIVQAYCHRLLFLRDGRLLIDAAPQQAFDRLQQLGETEHVPISIHNKSNGVMESAYPQ